MLSLIPLASVNRKEAVLGQLREENQPVVDGPGLETRPVIGGKP